MTTDFSPVISCRRCAVRTLSGLLFSFALVVGSPLPAWAWGAEGHKIVALIALHELTPVAKRRVQELVGGDLRVTLQEASIWADRVRPHRRETGPWHYVDIEITSRGYDRARDCPHDDCVVEQVAHDVRVLKNPTSSRGERIEALNFLIHFVGDMHQPLHCADNHDRGGNAVMIEAGRRHANLHQIWDADVVQALGRDPDEVAAGLIGAITQADRRSWAHGVPATWANESFALARTEIYSRIGTTAPYAPVVLPQGYSRSEGQVTARQLERAGVRLAFLLNGIFVK